MDLKALIARASEQKNISEGGLPPVEAWNPPFCGDIDIEIRADGTWFYQGTPIARPALVRLFSTVLRREPDGRTYLVTPVEKLGIKVVDAPFMAVEMVVQEGLSGPDLHFRTNVGDVVIAGPDHPLRFTVAGKHDQLKPYIRVRHGLDALVTRALAYDLVERAETLETPDGPVLAVRSAGALFSIDPPNRVINEQTGMEKDA